MLRSISDISNKLTNNIYGLYLCTSILTPTMLCTSILTPTMLFSYAHPPLHLFSHSALSDSNMMLCEEVLKSLGVFLSSRWSSLLYRLVQHYNGCHASSPSSSVSARTHCIQGVISHRTPAVGWCRRGCIHCSCSCGACRPSAAVGATVCYGRRRRKMYCEGVIIRGDRRDGQLNYYC